MPITISYTSRGVTITAELSTPAGTSPRGLVLIAYGSDGLTNNLSGPWATMIRDYAASLARAGFVALIPDYLGATKTQPGPTVFALIMEHRDHWQEAISDAITHAKSLPGVGETRVGLLGFSLGGHLCLRLRAKAKVLVEFFGPVLDGIGPPGTLTHAQIHHGKADQLPGTDFSNAETILNILKSEGTSTELFPYPGAGHGFIGNDPANMNARAQSKERTMSFFGAHLSG
jgi:dienelactone hydrolase